ncbi:hypothetical protein [uncultured Jatrophihabitans sp.]|uniref:hypothetical protein n=1 Tax=uncultured Jatrophihabitans sp. TaxID=1610747 RepID=UPI0035CC5CA4
MSASKKPVAALIGVLAMLIAGLFFASSAGAYPDGVAPVVTTSGTPTCGGSITVTGANYKPGETVNVTDSNGDSAAVTAGSDGGFSTSFPITCPNGTLPETLTASGGSGVDAVTLSNGGSTNGGGSGSGSGGLSNTGVAVIGIGAVGLVLLVGGGLLLMAGKRRKVSI